jgi:hypothetical protein
LLIDFFPKKNISNTRCDKKLTKIILYIDNCYETFPPMAKNSTLAALVERERKFLKASRSNFFTARDKQRATQGQPPPSRRRPTFRDGATAATTSTATAATPKQVPILRLHNYKLHMYIVVR